MLKFLADLIARFTSRKFLLTLAGALVLVANKQYTELVYLISGYSAVEGGGDIVQRYQTGKKAVVTAETQALNGEDLGVDTGTVVPGNTDPTYPSTQ